MVLLVMVKNKGEKKMNVENLTFPIMTEMPKNVRLSSFEYQAIAKEVLSGLERKKDINVIKNLISDSLPHNVRLSSAELGRMADACQEAWDRSNGINFVVKYWFGSDHDKYAGVYAGSAYFEVLVEAIEYKIREESRGYDAKVFHLTEFVEVS
jgi:hypothetical protein